MYLNSFSDPLIYLFFFQKILKIINRRVVFSKYTMEPSTSKPDIAWDLSPLFPSIESDKIKERKTQIVEKAAYFETTYKGNIDIPDPSADFILKMLKEYEDFALEYYELIQFSRLHFSANMTDPKIHGLFSEMQELSTNIGKDLTFLDLELSKLLSKNSDLINNPILKNYKHHLEKEYRAIPHNLSEEGEQIFLDKDQHGVKAWATLQSSWLNTRKFEVEVLHEP